MALKELIGYAASILGLLAFLPQAIKIWRTKETKDISLGMYIMFWLGVALWLAYGIFLKSFPIILVNAVVLALASVIMILKIKYK
ncbi:MAG: SemiSWEET transporter [bacterium]